MSTTSHTHQELASEVQRPRQWWIAAILISIAGLEWYTVYEQILRGRPFGDNPTSDEVVLLLWVIFGIIFPVVWLMMYLRVTVYADRIDIRYFPIYQRTVRLAEVNGVEARTYNALREYGGWGLRMVPWGNRRKQAISVSGNQGVELTLANGKQLLLGSHQPQLLADAIQDAQRAAGQNA